MTFQEYDEFCRVHSPHKIPKRDSQIFEYHVGDCIYDYSQGEQPLLRPSVHDNTNRKGDLRSISVLMSQDFYYFGNKPVHLPDPLTSIVHNRPGHKSKANDPYKDEFVKWIINLGYTPNQLHGEPQGKKKFTLERNISSCRPQCNRQNNKINKRSNC